jgi:hypothetical protein
MADSNFWRFFLAWLFLFYSLGDGFLNIELRKFNFNSVRSGKSPFDLFFAHICLYVCVYAYEDISSAWYPMWNTVHENGAQPVWR